MKVGILDNNTIINTLEYDDIKINNGVIIGINKNSNKIFIYNKDIEVEIEHSTIIKGIGFVEDIIVFIDEYNLYFLIINKDNTIIPIRIKKFENKIVLVNSGNQSMIMEKGKKKKYYEINSMDGHTIIIPSNRTKYERIFNRAKFLKSFIKNNELIIKIN